MASLDACWADQVVLVGAGAVGTVLGRRLAERGYSIRAVLSRSERSAQELARRLDAPLASARMSDLPTGARLIFCCVPDDAISDVAVQLAALPHAWPECIVAHTSGARTAAALTPLAGRGASVLSFHPMQTLSACTEPDALEGIYVGLEGDEEAVAAGHHLATDLGAHAVEIAAEHKPHYHLAAVLASNAQVTVADLALEVMSKAGMERQTAAAVLRPLMQSTAARLNERLPEEVLTGPVARGDVGTVEAHAAAMSGDLAHLLPVYVALSVETARLAVREGSLRPEAAEELLDALYDALKTYL